MSKSPMVIRRYEVKRAVEMKVEAPDNWRPFHAIAKDRETFYVWAIEEKYPLRRAEHVMLLVGGYGTEEELPELVALNGHVGTVHESPYSWHIFRSAKSPKVVK